MLFKLVFTRHQHSDLPEGSLAYATTTAYPANGPIAVELFFDSCLVDIFVDGGKRVYSCCIFPDYPSSVRVTLD